MTVTVDHRARPAEALEPAIASLPRPGVELADAIRAGVAAGRPSLRSPLSPALVPLLKPMSLDLGRAVLFPAAYLALHAAPCPAATREALDDRRSRFQLEALDAAAMRDVYGMPAREVESRLARAGRSYQSARGLRTFVSVGRQLWSYLSAWPWVIAGAHHDECWWERDAVAGAFAAWSEPHRSR